MMNNDPTQHLSYGQGGGLIDADGLNAYGYHYETAVNYASLLEDADAAIVHAQLATAAAMMANTKALSDLYAIIDEFHR